ncbi:hypothetical protein MKO06_15615 [Gramella sp. GC03-9]|uniref:Uncharacterized protein n=1 Tax=Christiangramia oceanisediminis TaxID=2920386 RepID=A0A9X2RAA6_9FLAO|nr:hypothetical protein [Gramella oceanisediminis]MCP9201337.1 hypothetical protein [Gramella oceanisediminis]
MGIPLGPSPFFTVFRIMEIRKPDTFGKLKTNTAAMSYFPVTLQAVLINHK